MAKELRIDDPDLIRKARESSIIVLGDRRFIALDSVMDTGDDADLYEPTKDEVARLHEAARDMRPRLRGSEADAYIARRTTEYGES